MNDAAMSLSALIASRRRLSAPEQIEATVHATDGLSTRIFHVVARSPTGEYRSVTDDRTLSFNLRTSELILESAGDPTLTTHRDEFPMTPPVLAMFSPLDLAIWDAASNYEVVDASREGESVRLDFSGPVGRGHAIVDLENHVAMELQYLDWIQHPSTVRFLGNGVAEQLHQNSAPYL